LRKCLPVLKRYRDQKKKAPRMPLVLSQVLDLRTMREPRRLALYDAIPRLRALDFYLTHEDLSASGSKTNPLHSALPVEPLSVPLVSARVFLPPYAQRTESGAYTAAAFGELDRALDVAESLRDRLRVEEIGLTFHHVTEWPTEIDEWPLEVVSHRLSEDRDLGAAFVTDVAVRCRRRGILPCLENLAPVRNDHAAPHARMTPRYETGFCGPQELRRACEQIDGLRVALDVCHLALGCEARRSRRQPRINALELEGDPTWEAPPPYDFADAIRAVAPHLACVHLSGCAGDRKEVHEGGIPGEPGDRIDLPGLLAQLEAIARSRTIPVTVETRDAHTEIGFSGVAIGLRRVSAILEMHKKKGV
jgi:sugar phosphate isomerase/epimerase